MATAYPGGIESFTEPPDPENTALGDATYDHAVHHQDMGDTVEALQAEVGTNSDTVNRKVVRLVSGGGDKIWVQSSQPSSPTTGDLWVDLSRTHYPTRLARKSADQSVTSSTTLVNDTHLVIAVDANATYSLEAFLMASGATAADIKYAFAIPSGATLWWGLGGPVLSASSGDGSVGLAAAQNTATLTAGIVAARTVSMARGTFRTAGTSGDLQLRWAQNASSGTATVLHADSWIRLIRV